MLRYEFPKPLSVYESRIYKINAQNEIKKAKRMLLKNIILSIIIIVLAFMIEILLLKILVILVGLTPLITAYYVFTTTCQRFDQRLTTRIYDDRIEHTQFNAFKNCYQHFIINFCDVIESVQTSMGDLEITLNAENNSSCEIIKKNSSLGKNNIQGKIVFKFIISEAKYCIINNFSNEMRYKKR